MESKNYKRWMPLVSVCVPAYNAEKFVVEAIQSVLDQNYENVELIIVDDASNDTTASIIEKFVAERKVQVKFEINPMNLGLAGNWNKVLSMASGKYIKILPGDDKISANNISESVKALEENSDLVMAFSSRVIIDSDSREKFKINFFKEGRYSARSLIGACMLMGTNIIGEPGAVLFRKEVAEKVGDFDGSLPYVIDVDYWVRLLQFGGGYKLNFSVKAFFRISENLSVTLGCRRYKDYQTFLKKITKRYGYGKVKMYIGVFHAFINDVMRRIVHWMVSRS